jgi:hypothetical protein
MSDYRRCSSADSENMRKTLQKNFAAGRSVKNFPPHSFPQPVDWAFKEEATLIELKFKDRDTIK